MILAVLGAKRAHEGVNLKLENVKDRGKIILVSIKKKKKKRVSTGNLRLRASMRIRCEPGEVPMHRFYLNYTKQKCTTQPIGMNKFHKMPGQK